MRKAEPPPLAPDDTLRTALRLILDEGLDHLEAHRAAARAGGDEAIHQARVAMRRLRSALRLLGRLLDPASRDGFNGALRDLGRTLGAARDWDVFVLETVPAIRAADAGAGDALERLLAPAQRERDAAHLVLQATLDDPRTAYVLHDLRDWGSTPAALPDHEQARRPIGRLAPSMLDRLARRARRRGRHLERQDDAQRHDLRKALKALRYGIEMLEALYPAAAVKGYRRALGGLQEDLGRLNDAIAAAELAGRLPGEPDAARAVRSWSDEQRQAGLAALPDAWARFRAMPPFW